MSILKNTIIEKGFLITILLSVTILIIFYGKLLGQLNSVFFGSSGDALQTYYTSLYHFKFDKEYFHFQGMNYPYGENIFFTGAHIPIVNSFKAVCSFFDMYNYLIGIINLITLISIVLCSLSIYLIFIELRLPIFYSSIAAVGITFLSPQIHRMGGTLAYQFVIPSLIYLLMKFYQHPSLKKSIIISLLTFFMMTTHLYFFAFFGIIIFFYWTILFFSYDKNFSRIKFVAKHFIIQLLLPFLLFETILFFTDNVTDRTKYPWGFLVFKSSLGGVLFPFGKPYEFFVSKFYTASHVEWEGMAFIGLVSVLALFCIAFIFIKKIFKFKRLLIIDNNRLINIFFWTSIAALIYSFGFPFIYWGSLLDYAGPFRQMRGIGRFNWIFFYVINIIAFYKLYYWLNSKKIFIKYFITTAACSVLLIDAFYNVKGHQDELNNNVAQLIDKDNKLAENEWIKNFKAENYQAIIPLPYVHIGSENIWIAPSSDIMKYTYIVSLKTGLPTTAVSLSRTSLSQTYKNISLVLEPYKSLEILKDFPNQKPFLVLAKENEMNENEKKLLSKCELLTKTSSYDVYSLNFHSLEHLTDSLYWHEQEKFHEQKTFLIDNYYSSDSLKNFIHDDFEENPSAIAFKGRGAYQGNIHQYNILYEGNIPNMKADEYLFSFWMYNFKKDLYPRSAIEIDFSDSGGKLYQVDNPSFQSMLKILDGDWALLEQKFKLKTPSDKIKIVLWNPELRQDKKVIIDELWVKPLFTNIYQESKENIFKNNRYYHL